MSTELTDVPITREMAFVKGYAKRQCNQPFFELWGKIIDDTMSFALMEAQTGNTLEFVRIEGQDITADYVWDRDARRFVDETKNANKSTLCSIIFGSPSIPMRWK